LNSRSSQSLRSSSGIDGYRICFSEFTIARSRPAFTQWYRNTEFRTSRPASGRPKETFEIPRIVLHSGNAALIARIPSIVSAALPTYFSSPVPHGKTSGSKMRSSAATPYFSVSSV
jgi:hypothetical protein